MPQIPFDRYPRVRSRARASPSKVRGVYNGGNSDSGKRAKSRRVARDKTRHRVFQREVARIEATIYRPRRTTPVCTPGVVGS